MKIERRICVAFDLDDTLFKERDYVKTGRAAVAQHFASHASLSSDELLLLMETASDAFDALLALSSIKESGITIDDILEVYRTHRPILTLPVDTERSLKALHEGGADLAIITDGRSITQRNKIEALRLDGIIDDDKILISEEVGADKLTARPFETLMERCTADRYYMVGDNPTKDFYHPNLLGWTSIMLCDTEGVNVPSQCLDNIQVPYWPQIFIDNLTQLPSLCLPR